MRCDCVHLYSTSPIPLYWSNISGMGGREEDVGEEYA